MKAKKNKVEANIKMFQVGELGDCFLLSFKHGVHDSRVLIDCGSFRNKNESQTRLREIAAYIKTELKGKKLDVVVGTHQHNDHVSGFVHAEDIFREIVEQVWLSWLDNPNDKIAKQIRREHKNLVAQVTELRNQLNIAGFTSHGEIVDDILGFYAASGGPPEIPAKGVEILKEISEKEVSYLSPGEYFDLPGLPPETVKVYVLGPPRNKSLLYDKDPGKEETYDHSLNLAGLNVGKMADALINRSEFISVKSEDSFPFSKSLKKTAATADPFIVGKYNEIGKEWRKIDLEWLEQANRLALFLDSFTNNSSLVLAFELVKSKKVLLFAADAQTGNWISWENIKWEGKANFKTYDLLENTVLYKVGHHASHNATLVKGLEAMKHEELVAMIPVDKNDANITKANGWKMPAKNLFKRLKVKTGYKVLRMDEGFAEGCKPGDAKTSWHKLPSTPKEDSVNGFIEYTVHG